MATKSWGVLSFSQDCVEAVLILSFLCVWWEEVFFIFWLSWFSMNECVQSFKILLDA